MRCQWQFTDGFADGMCLALQWEGMAADGLAVFIGEAVIITADKQVLQRCIAAVTDVGYGLINMVVRPWPNMA